MASLVINNLHNTDEPPYFLPRNSSNHSIDAHMDRSRLYPGHITSQPQRLQRSVTGGSSVGDYRSVIDDLTIENQKLKQATAVAQLHVQQPGWTVLFSYLIMVQIHHSGSGAERGGVGEGIH